MATAHGTEAYTGEEGLDALLAASDAVAFAVPPDVQAPLAVRAAEAGCHLLLDKPVATTVRGRTRTSSPPRIGSGHVKTAPWNEYSYGVSNRGASVRIPWQVEQDQKGYIEDRRPNANVDPYVVTRLIVDTCCTALEKADQV
ncbi:Gfo/Idh/MocA family oxidoreductase [Streptomyces sp. wa22]|uniref:Gfo/Idh/MocA family oxidoreductase n=1 Tax=Streptomyces sp. wa22 TaxID=1828244 RepID=UPI0039676558